MNDDVELPVLDLYPSCPWCGHSHGIVEAQQSEHGKPDSGYTCKRCDNPLWCVLRSDEGVHMHEWLEMVKQWVAPPPRRGRVRR